MEGPHESPEGTMDCEDADSSCKEPVEKKPRINEDAALTNEGPTQSSTKREGDGDGADENEPAAKRYRPRSSRSRSPCPGLPKEPPHEDRLRITGQKGIMCAVCQQTIPESSSWNNWVYMAPGSWGVSPGRDLMRRVVSLVEFPQWVHYEQAWVGVHGTFVPLCKWCMYEMVVKLPKMNEYKPETATEGANATDGTNRTVSHEQAIIAGLICQQLKAKVNVAKRNVEDIKAVKSREVREVEEKLNEDLQGKCSVSNA